MEVHKMYKIALVEDEKNLAALVVKYLCAEGYEVVWYATGEDAEKAIPGSIISKIHKSILSSARDQDIDKIMGLELGSDDYLAKPYSIRELVLRVKNLLIRSYQHLQTKDLKNETRIGNYLLDKDRRSVYYDNSLLQLTSKEYDLLLYLVENPGKAFSRDQILNAVWGEDYFGSDRVVDDLLRRLRQKMPELQIETIYGYGYRLLVA